MKNCHTVVQSGYPILPFHQHFMRILFLYILIRIYSLFYCGHLIMKSYLIMVLIFISLVKTDVEHLSVYSLNISILSLKKICLWPFWIFLVRLCLFTVELWIVCSRYKSFVWCRICKTLKNFFAKGFLFTFLMNSLRYKEYSLVEVESVYFFLMLIMLVVFYLRLYVT